MQRSPRTGFIDLSDDFSFSYFVLAVTVLAVVVFDRIFHSRFGEVLKAIRDNEPSVETLGFKPEHNKLVAMALSAGMAGSRPPCLS